MNSPYQRIESLVSLLGYNSIYSLAKALGYKTPDVFYNIKKGKTKNISREIIQKLTALHPAVNPNYLSGDSEEALIEVEENKEGYKAESDIGQIINKLDAILTESNASNKHKLVSQLKADVLHIHKKYIDALESREEVIELFKRRL
ncbi:MAG: hypothetical protein NXI20_28260 [bacterium]|nr:hypothetical protein [bacterium]